MKEGIKNSTWFLLIFFCFSTALHAQQPLGTISGKIVDESKEGVIGALVKLDSTPYTALTDIDGKYLFSNVPYGTYNLSCVAFGAVPIKKKIVLDQSHLKLNLKTKQQIVQLSTIEIEQKETHDFSHTHLHAVDGFGIYEGKKTEVVDLAQTDANMATNNARQVYAKITGLNIWESDGAGLQLGIGGRGLSPNRTANFNVRQNGYDISADALGYPESYYTPPIEALERIEVVRGAASLQYGTQFGGMVNFKFKEGPKDKKIELTSRQTAGSWGFFNSFNSVGGTVGKLNYYAYVQYKKGNGYRPNSEFDYYNGYASFNYQATAKLKLNFDVTKMHYLAQQAGGLTDRQFEENPRQSFRARNWFKVDWNLFALTATYEFNAHTQINVRNFALFANRQSLGNLERINVIDFGENRTLIDGSFQNFGNETRLLHKYHLGKEQHVFLTGIRAYSGTSLLRQGDADSGSDPNFKYLNPSNLENSDYRFPSKNYSAFAENIFHISKRFTLTPGVRLEHIYTASEGYYKIRVFDGAGNLVAESITEENDTRTRNFALFGLGAKYELKNKMEVYGNISQNYKAINFSDLRIVNLNFKVDENIQDESGYTADLGIRGTLNDLLTFEATGFLMYYNNKIGQVLRSDTPPLYIDYRFRSNISDARNVGIELFGEMNLWKLFKTDTTNSTKWTVFTNFAYVDARYINTQDNSIKNKKVEMVPPIILRTGTSVRHRNFRSTIQYSFVSKHFSDATNALRTATAVEGVIPSYQIVDLSMSYSWKKFTLEGSINNVLNNSYFTRRAESYPGPGIIPSDGRSFYLTLQVKL